METVEVLIIGAGPAGLTAGLYSARSGLFTVIFEKTFPGGLANLTDRIDNYPGFPEGISGMELGQRMHQQAQRWGAGIVSSRVDRIWKHEDSVLVSVKGSTVTARTAIIATGSAPRRLGVPGEKELTGKGVSYCATCDGPLYTGAVTAVVGGGDSALQEAIFLARFASKVIVVHRRAQLRAAAALQKEAREHARIDFVLSSVVKGIEGDQAVKSILVEDRKTGGQQSIPVDGVFIYVGYDPNNDLVGPEFERNQSGFLLTKPDLETSVPGIFAAGDIRDRRLRQVVTAAGDGAVAAVSAYAYLEGLKNVP